MKKSLFEEVKKDEAKIINFLRDLIAIPSESCKEKLVIERIKSEMEDNDFDSINIDGMGNILGRIGNGKRIIAMDAHVDTVGTGRVEEWEFDPYKGQVHNGKVYGRGAVDQKAGMACLVYGAKFIKKFDLLSDFTLYIVGSVQEEDCDGLCWQYIINEDKIKPECVIITEPTNLNIHRGHRGRMEISISTIGKAGHASMPERGKNAIYSMAEIVRKVKCLNENLKSDPFLGKGSVAVTDIKCKSPSLCAIPDECYIHLDRRLTTGENKESALEEIENIIKEAGITAKVDVLKYEKPGYKGLVYPTECYFPSWVLPRSHPLLKAAVQTHSTIFTHLWCIDKWNFSTNGVATMGMYNIPTIGFGPGNEIYAHSTEEYVSVDQLLDAVVWYASFPEIYIKTLEEV